MEDYHTHYIGKTKNGNQFWAYQTFVFTKPPHEILITENWGKFRREYVVLHTYDKEGDLKETKYWFAGTTDKSSEEEIEKKLEEFVKNLGEIVFCPIEIKLFQTKIEQFTFGLIPNEEFKSINLEPSSLISFYEPWDGEYFT